MTVAIILKLTVINDLFSPRGMPVVKSGFYHPTALPVARPFLPGLLAQAFCAQKFHAATLPARQAEYLDNTR